MSTPTLILGNNKWAIEEDNILGYAVEDRNGSYLPREIPFTRGSDATFTTSTGVIRQACWNLIGYSEEFDNAYWTKSNSSITTNAATAPNGALTADALIENTSNSTHRIFNNTAISVSTTIASTYSVYLKSAGRTRAWVRDNDILGALFNLSTGTVVSSDIGVTASMTNVGDGWYRCTITRVSSTTSGRIVVYLDNGTSDTYIGNGTSGVYIWGAQLVQGSDALGYLRTTDMLNMPRVDSSTGTKAFLLEPQRTNLALYSDQFNISGTWTNTINGTGVTPTVTTNSTTSPDGTQNAETIVFNRGTGNTLSDLTALQQSITIPTTGAYILSVYAKASTAGDIGKQVFLRLGGAGVLVPITLTQNWVRYSRAETSVASGSQIIQIGNRGTITADNTVSVDLFGAQVEAGAYPTTYIPTQATTVTRIADSAVKTGISGLIGQTEGTLFVEFNSSFLESYTQRILTLSDGTNTNAIGFQLSSANQLIFYVENGGVNQVAITKTSPSITLGSNVKIAAAYANNDFVFYVNGTQIGTDTSGSVPATSQLRFSEGNGTAFYYGQIKQVALYTSRVSNSELAALTTL